MIRKLFALAALALTLAAAPAMAQTSSSITVKDGAGATATLGAGAAGGKLFYGLFGAAADGSVYALPSAAQFAATLGPKTGALSPSFTPATDATFDTVVKSSSVDRGLIVTTANTAQQLMAANPARRGWSVQNQSAGSCYVSGLATATADYHSLLIASGSYYETKDSHTGTGALSIVCTVASASVYAREW